MASLFATLPVLPAVADSDSPFGDAVRVADGTLDTMRGGFSDGNGGMFRFAVNLQTVVNGTPISSLSVSNDAQGNIHASEQNIGRTFVLQPDGSVQVKTATSQNAPSTPPTSGTPAPIVTTQQSSSVTVQVSNPATTSVPSGNGGPQGSSSQVIVTTTLAPTLPSTVSAGAVLATTSLLPNGNGVMTLIQNTQSNVVIHAMQNLNIQLSGVSNSLLGSVAALHGFANSLRLSTHR